VRLAVIPARGGSKRIPGKNIRLFLGKPMIAWSIEAAKASGCFDRIVVSTDDPDIAQVARDFGAETPFLRPLELADDVSGTTPVVQHAVQTLINRDGPVDQVCCLYATAPFVRPEDLCRGLETLESSGADFAFSVTTFPFPVQRALRFRDGRVEMLYPKYFETRSQDLEEAWHDAGQFYWGKAKAWLEAPVIFSPRSAPVELPRYRVQDIDTTEDWIRAEWMMKSLKAMEEYEE